jgi:hypothetical protein
MLEKTGLTTAYRPDPKFSTGDVIVTKINGIDKKRHIYDKPAWDSVKGADGKLIYEGYIYPVDYGLGCTSEGFARESSMRKCISPDDDCLVL